jgi:hypothetical protein
MVCGAAEPVAAVVPPCAAAANENGRNTAMSSSLFKNVDCFILNISFGLKVISLMVNGSFYSFLFYHSSTPMLIQHKRR